MKLSKIKNFIFNSSTARRIPSVSVLGDEPPLPTKVGSSAATNEESPSLRAGRFFNYWPLGLIFLLIFIFFWKVWLKGFLPLPADTIVGMYHPWRDLYTDNYPQGIPFKNFLITDPVRQLYPWRWLAIEGLKSEKLPLWNPYSFAGTPLLANFQSAPFYIFNILFFIFNFNAAWRILIFLQPLLAAVFLYLYLRQLKLSPIPSLVGGLSFAFSGFFIAWLEWGTVLHSALWLPLILLSIEKIIKLKTPPRCPKDSSDGGGTKLILFWGFVFVFSLVQSFFAGHLQTFFYVFLFSLIYLIWKLFCFTSEESDVSLRFTLPPSEVKKRLKLVFVFLILYTFFFILSSFQWQPTLQFIKLSARGVDQAGWQQEGWFIPWKHLVQFLAPDFFGNPTTLNYWGEWNYGEFVGYIGVIPLIFALYAIFFVRTKYFILYCGATNFVYTLFFILFLSFALPTPWAKLPYVLKLPFISTAQPTRMIFLVDFCLAVLAALGLNEYFRLHLGGVPSGHHPRWLKRKFRFLVLPIVLYTTLWLFVFVAPKIWSQLEWVDNLVISQRNLILPSGVLIAGIVLIWVLRFKKIPFRIVFGLLLLITCFDLLRFGWKFTPFTKKDWLFPTTKAIEFLKSDKEVFRIMAVDRRIFPPNFSAIYKLQDVAGYDPLYLLRYGELIAASERGKPDISPPFGFNRIVTPQNYTSPITDLLNVKYILSLADLGSPKLDLVFQEGETRVYQNRAVFPRAFLVYDYRVAQNKKEAINFLFEPKIDLKKTAILEEEIDLAPTDQLIENQVRIVEYQPNLVKLEVVSKHPGILVLTDAFYPGWQVFLNDQKMDQTIFRVNYTFRGIIVPEGEHKIKFLPSL